MISINEVSLYFGDRPLFQDVSLFIQPKDRIGIVGKNGAGKSTLLKMILGEISKDSGEITIPKDIEPGYLPQKMTYDNDQTLWEEVWKAFPEIQKSHQQINQLNRELAERDDYQSEEYGKIANRLSEINARLEITGAPGIEAEIEKTILGLGFTREDFSKPTSIFSGGWRMRIELAKILLRNPDILLLDEPTNHLDIESIQWLEDYLSQFQGALLLISHDKTFLDRVTKRTVEITQARINDYPAPYSKFVEIKKERIEQQKAAYANQQKKIAETQDFIDRFRYKATKASQVQSRIKQLEKLQEIVIDEEDQQAINIQFPPAPRSGSIVIETHELEKSFGTNTILYNLHLTVERGEKLAFVGQNGAGKSTLSKILVGELSYDAGSLKTGHNVKIGYYAQNQDELLDEEKTVWQTIKDETNDETLNKIRNYLGAFLFHDDDVEKKVKVLSGGERSRLALIKLLLQPVNLLILDEPTNHLDMTSKDILKEALLKFEGTMIVVSHDRDFLDGLVDKIYEFKNQNIWEYTGNIYEFLKKKKIDSFNELEKKNQANTIKNDSSNKIKRKQAYEEKKEADRQLRKVKKQITQNEEDIERIEKRMEELKNLLSDPASLENKGHNPELYKEYEDLEVKLEKAMEEWENLHEEYEQMQNS